MEFVFQVEGAFPTIRQRRSILDTVSFLQDTECPRGRTGWYVSRTFVCEKMKMCQKWTPCQLVIQPYHFDKDFLGDIDLPHLLHLLLPLLLFLTELHFAGDIATIEISCHIFLQRRKAL